MAFSDFINALLELGGFFEEILQKHKSRKNLILAVEWLFFHAYLSSAWMVGNVFSVCALKTSCLECAKDSEHSQDIKQIRNGTQQYKHVFSADRNATNPYVV